MVKLELEYLIKSSPKILYTFISTPNGLSDWFADKVDVKNDVYSFTWNGSSGSARLVAHKENEFVKFHWTEDSDKNHYFEFRIKIDELTGDVALLVTDFSEEDECEENKMLWDAQVHDLMHKLGS